MPLCTLYTVDGCDALCWCVFVVDGLKIYKQTEQKCMF